MSGKKWQWSMFFQQLLVCCQCPNPKSLNNHCYGRSSQGKTIHYLINSHKLPSPPPTLLLLKLILLFIYHYHLCFCSVGSPCAKSIYSTAAVFQQIKQTQKLYSLQTAQNSRKDSALDLELGLRRENLRDCFICHFIQITVLKIFTALFVEK